MGAGHCRRFSCFFGEFLHGVLLKTLNVISQFVNVEPLYHRYGEKVESIEHTLCDGPASKGFWALVSHLIGLIDEKWLLMIGF